ncbi:MAG TPA: hypothetical protein VFA04_03990, partial [Bryobacteraceae bacterium]|nr:hypothetical protein [Bryobacteraceae bacterium]
GSGAAVDTKVAHSGKNSIRFENFTPENPVWLEQPLRVQRWRSYRLRCWVKTENAAPGAPFHVWARAKDGRDLAYMEPVLPSTSGWKELIWHFNSWYAESVDLGIGIEEGRSGTVWVDDVQVEETGLVNVLRRPGTPVTVRNDATGEVYQEGRDFAPMADPNLNFRWDHDGPAIHLLTGSRIHDGDRLRVDYYHGTTIYRDQVPIDMSEPAVYEIWRRNVALLAKKLAPRKYFLSMDEVRVGGFCQACKRRRLSMAQILGDCVTRQFQMIRDVNPKAEVWVWSDMFDPNHNAREQYYLIDGSFRETVQYIPRELHIACWYYEKRDLSLSFFSKLGYHTLGAAYYDADDLTNPRGWMESLARTPGAEGIMYTTWENKYGLLGPFGDLVAGSGLAPGR